VQQSVRNFSDEVLIGLLPLRNQLRILVPRHDAVSTQMIQIQCAELFSADFTDLQVVVTPT